jgi:hypothetical protein
VVLFIVVWPLIKILVIKLEESSWHTVYQVSVQYRITFGLAHQSPGYFDHVLELIVIIFKNYFENNQNILTSSSSMGFLPIKLMIIII